MAKVLLRKHGNSVHLLETVNDILNHGIGIGIGIF